MLPLFLHPIFVIKGVFPNTSKIAMYYGSRMPATVSELARNFHKGICHSVMERNPDSIKITEEPDSLSLLFPRNGIKINIRKFYTVGQKPAYLSVLYFENLSHALCLFQASQISPSYYVLGSNIRLIPFLGRSNDPFGYYANAELVLFKPNHETEKIKCQFESPSDSKNFMHENLLSVCFSIQQSNKETILELIQAIHDLPPGGLDMPT